MKINLQDLKDFIGESNLNVPNLLEMLLEVLDSEDGREMMLDDLHHYINAINKKD
jgi:hypothetical protein